MFRTVAASETASCRVASMLWLRVAVAWSQANAGREGQLRKLMDNFEPDLQSAALASAAWLTHFDALLTLQRCTLLTLFDLNGGCMQTHNRRHCVVIPHRG
jgi:hypothetical protein